MYKVLIADDEPFILDGLKKAIPWEDFRLQVAGLASNGMDAWDAVNTGEIDILITDIRMPKMNGIELLRRIREKDLPVKCVVLSGYDEFSYVKECARLGIENYLLKPVNFDECYSTLTNIVEKLDAQQRFDHIHSSGLEVLLDNIILRWMTGEIDLEELTERGEMLDIDLRGGFVSCVMEYDGENAGLPELLRGMLNDTGRGYAVSQPYNRMFLLFRASSPNDARVSALADEIARLSPTAFMALGDYQASYETVYQSTYRASHQRLGDRPTDQPGEKKEYSEAVARILKYTEENYHREMSLKTIAADFGMNPLYLGQLFKNEIDEFFTDYLNKLRVQRSKALLRQKMSIKETAARVGYLSSSYYCTMFRKYEGISPREYREANG